MYDDQGKLVSALARGVQILRCFTADTPELSARALIDSTKLPKPTFFRLAATLCAAGLLRYCEATAVFMPAPGLLTLAASLWARTHVRQLAFGQMQALADRVCGQVTLALGAGLDLVFVELAQSSQCTTFRPAMGAHISLSRTATGRAYLAAQPVEQTRRYTDGVTAADPQQGQWLAARLAETHRDLQQRGFCISRGDLHRELEAVAVPVRSTALDEIYVLTCTVPVFELAPGQLEGDIGPRLVALARSTEAAMGHSPNDDPRWLTKS
ncbi:MAG: helix-turn-helix domain-containing protein [Burkholderiaceae bacterium]|jgi:DNA-binding IclR family transcriptional regulator|nr:helix-turn-helix domain-containing protein [Burkholderiaceae bacterium]